MPTYTFYVYSSSVLSYNGGTGNFDFASGYDHTQDRYQIDVSDDDSVMNASGDANQIATVYDMDGNLVDSGNIFVPAYAAIDDGAGGTIFLDRIEVNGVHYGYVSTQPLSPGTSYPLTSSSTFEEDHTYYQTNSTPCFGPATLIDTPSGPRPITTLRVGDMVLTRDHGPQPILWAGQKTITPLGALAAPEARPIRLTRHPAVLQDLTCPLILSQQHRVLIDAPLVALFADTTEAFVAAKALCRSTMPRRPITWHHILLARHEVIRANGAWVESLFAGDQLDHMLDAPDLQRIYRSLGPAGHRLTARPCLRAFEARVLLDALGSSAANNRNIRVARQGLAA